MGLGKNSSGELGINDSDSISVPTPINITNVKDIGCGYMFLTLITEDDKFYVTGHNEYGGLGIGNTNDVKTFTLNELIDISNTKYIFLNIFGMNIFKNDGTMYGCGLNSQGQCATGSFSRVQMYPTKSIITDIETPILNILEYKYALKYDNKYCIINKNNELEYIDDIVNYSSLYSGLDEIIIESLPDNVRIVRLKYD